MTPQGPEVLPRFLVERTDSQVHRTDEPSQQKAGDRYFRIGILFGERWKFDEIVLQVTVSQATGKGSVFEFEACFKSRLLTGVEHTGASIQERLRERLVSK